MKPRIRLGLTSLAFWVPALLRTLDSNKRQIGIFFVAYVLLTCFLFVGKRWAFRVYRFLLWFVLIISIILILLAMSLEMQMLQLIRKFTNSSSTGEAIVYTLIWIVFLGGVLYYSDKDHVRAAYGLGPKKGNLNNQQQEDPINS